jgi:hypothetical protein
LRLQFTREFSGFAREFLSRLTTALYDDLRVASYAYACTINFLVSNDTGGTMDTLIVNTRRAQASLGG